MLGLAIALFSLWRHLRKSMDLCGEPGWQAPSRLQMLRASAPMYGVGLLASLHGPPVFLLILQRMLGVEATAAFGFLRSLYQLAVRYLPATLLAGVLRPRLVASQVDGGDIRATADDANLAGKLSLFVLMPLLGFAAVHGELAVALLSGGRFPSTGWLLFGLWLGLVPLSQRALLEAVAVSAGQSNLCMRAAFLGPLSLPLMIGLVLAGAGIAAAVVALVIGNLLFVALILLGLARRLRYPYDGRGLLRMLFAATLAGLVTWAVDLGLPAGLGGRSHAALGAAAAILAFLGCARLVRPFTAAERDRLNRVFRRKVFIW
jgi:O-antigen/teichoic acid export membrane protein